MAIVEDDVRNESEEENEIEVVVEDEDGEQESGDDDSDDDDEEEALETKVAELEKKIAEDPYNYDIHIELIQALWGLSELERWRSAFDQLQQISLLQPQHWLLRLQTEVSLAHSPQARDQIVQLFEQATLDCYSIPILSEWCSWSLSAGDVSAARENIDEVIRRAGADPLSGKLFWDAKTELEKAQLDNLSESEPSYKQQVGRVLFCLEEIVSRPLLHGEEVWARLEELALKVHSPEFVDKVKKQHEAAVDFLQKITPFEDRLLTTEDPEEKCKVYQEYIDTVKELSREKKFAECDSDGILKVLYDRATTECLASPTSYELLRAYASHTHARSSRATYWRVLCACVRRCPRRDAFWIQQMRHKEKEGGTFDEIKSILETALSKGLDTYKDTENLWMSYLEYMRRNTAFDNEQEVERLRRTFRLAWDSLAESWGAEANDCEVPLYWARLEYKRMGDPKQGKEIFEEIFKYGENKTMSKYWEAFISLESSRAPPPSEHKLRELHRRALKFVSDYPPAVVRLYTDLERDVGTIDSMRTCVEDCEAKLKEWRESYQAMKDKMTGQKQKGKQQQNKKAKFDKTDKKGKKEDSKPQNKSKRKAEDGSGGSEVKKKRDTTMDIDGTDKDANTSGSLKRTHGGKDSEATDNKRQRRDSSTDSQLASREACTLFVSNLEFKVNEQNLRDKLLEYGDITSLRVRAGVKAFGGSICYCQYKSPSSVDEAVKHDRTPLDGRPMFFSRYSSKKEANKKTFKYSTEAEKSKLFVKNIPFEMCTTEALTEVFGKFGSLKDVRAATHKDGRPKGLAYIEYEDAATASQALEKSNGLLLGERKLDVAISAPPPKAGPSNLGQPKREPTGGMRRTQLSQFIPSVLQKPSTSKATNGDHSKGDEKRPLSNSDFRSLLLK